jgi:hypothetical protein
MSLKVFKFDLKLAVRAVFFMRISLDLAEKKTVLMILKFHMIFTYL